MLDDIARRRDHYRWNAVLFEVARNQTHGLVAYGSYRYEHGRVDRVFTTAFQHLRCVDF